ncbi:Fimbrial protein, partial [Dysosmobacter welbionis]
RCGGRAGPVFCRDRRLRAHLCRRRHCPGLPHHPGPGHGRGLLYAGAVFLPVRRVPHQQGADRRQLYEGVLGRGQRPGQELAAVRPGRSGQALLRGGRGLLRALCRQAVGRHGHHPFQGAVHHVQLRRADH